MTIFRNPDDWYDAIVCYCGQPARVTCDAQCAKAWGLNSRQRVQLSTDEDDYAFLSDDEVGIAPTNPGTYEGDCPKPLRPVEFPTKWCVRECERCAMSGPDSWDEPLPKPSFTQRNYNMLWRQETQP